MARGRGPRRRRIDARRPFRAPGRLDRHRRMAGKGGARNRGVARDGVGDRRRAHRRAAGAALRRRGDRSGPALAPAVGCARHRRLRGGHAAGRAAQALARRAAGRLPHGVRLLVHGLRDRRRHRRQDGASGARDRRAGRRRQLPDAELGDRDLGHARHEARHRRAGQPRLRLHPSAAAGGGRRRLQQPVRRLRAGFARNARDRLRGACARSRRAGRARGHRSPSSRQRSPAPAPPIARTSWSSTPIPCAPPRRAAGGGRWAYRKSPQRTRCAPRGASSSAANDCRGPDGRAHRHQPDFVDQRRSSGAGRRDAARDGADRGQGDRLRGLRARQQVSAPTRGTAGGARAAWSRVRVRLVFGTTGARDRGRRNRVGRVASRICSPRTARR